MSCEYCNNPSPKFDMFDIDNAETKALLHGCGFTNEDFKKPRIAVYNTLNPLNPGHMHQRRIAERVKEGIREEGGLPLEFNGTNLCDSMFDNQAWTLPSRDLLVADIELMVSYHRLDAMVLIGSCDKILPALLMAAARLDLPTVIVTGGYMKTGEFKGEHVDFIDIGINRTKLYDGKITREEFDQLCDCAVPGGGACGMMGTGNTMAIITEAIGMSLPGNSNTPGVGPEMDALAKSAGKQVMELLRKGITPRQIITKKSIINAIKVCMAVGGSGNTIIHVPAVAYEAEVDIDFSEEYAGASFEIPLLVGVRPNGPSIMLDYDRAGGTRAIMHEIKDHLSLDCMCVNEKSVGENIEGCDIRDESVIHRFDDPLDKEGGLALLKGNLVPDGCYVKQSAVPDCLMKMRGKARVFNNMPSAMKALRAHDIEAGSIVVIRYLGPKASYDSAYWFTSALKGSDVADSVATITDGCLSGAAQGASFQFAAPEAALNSPLAAVRDGDIIEYDIAARTMHVELSDEQIAQRISELKGDEYPVFSGYLGLYQRNCNSVAQGAVLGGRSK